METELVIEGVGFPPLSARACVQTLSPLEAGRFERTINGELIYTGNLKHQKYQSTITCQHKTSLALEGLWRGSIVQVECLQRLWQQANQGRVIPERSMVPGSVLCLGGYIRNVETKEILVKGEGEIFVSYRPKLTMIVVKFSLLTDEWGLVCGWNLHLEEV